MAGWPAHIKDFEDWTKEDVFNDREDSVIFSPTPPKATEHFMQRYSERSIFRRKWPFLGDKKEMIGNGWEL